MRTLHIPPTVHAALQRGEVIEAIRLLRESAGLDLRDAKQAIDALRRPGGGPAAPATDHRADPAATAHMDGTSQGTGLPADVEAALRQGNVIEAIRRLRAAAPMNLRDAKAAIDQHRRASTPHYAPTVAKGDDGGRAAWWALLLVLAVGAAAWWFVRA